MSTQLQTAMNAPKKPSDHPIIARIQAQEQKFAEAMPEVMQPQRFMRIAIGAIRRNPKLLECDALSLMGTLLVAAQLGLEVNTPLGHFYLIPRWNKKTGKLEADGQIGYKGWIELLDRTGLVSSMTAEVVHEKDQFLYRLGDDPRIDHVPNLADRGKPIAYYVSIRLTNGGVFRKVLSRSDVEKYRARSQSPNAGPWVSDFDSMALKTTFLRLVTWLPKSLEIKRASAYENALEANGSVKFRDEGSKAQIEFVIPDPEPEPEVDDYGGSDTFDVTPDQEEETEPDDRTPVDTRAQAAARPTVKASRKRSTNRAPMEVTEERNVHVEKRPFREADPPQRPQRPANEFTDAPFDDDGSIKPRPPKQDVKPAVKTPHPLATSVHAMETWAKNAAAKHDDDGLPDLADRNQLMERIYENLARKNTVSGSAKEWYSRLNEIAKFAGDADNAVKILEKANEEVRIEYLGVPDDAAQPAEKESAETPAERLQAIEDWFTRAGHEFERLGIAAYVMPQAVLGEIYRRAAAEGIVKGDVTGYRTRMIEFSECEMSLKDLLEVFRRMAKEISVESREPGSEG